MTREGSRTPLFPWLIGPLSAGVAVVSLTLGGDAPLESAVLAFLAFACGAQIVPIEAHWQRFLPLMGTLLPAAGVLAGLPLLIAIQAATGMPGLTALELGAVSLLVAIVSAMPDVFFRRRRAPVRPLRVAFIGSARSAELLAAELALAKFAVDERAWDRTVYKVTKGGGCPPENWTSKEWAAATRIYQNTVHARSKSYLLIGRVTSAPDASRLGCAEPSVSTLGTLAKLSAVVEEHEVDLLIVERDEDRGRIFDELVRSCMHLPVRLTQFTTFYGEVFGHVPIAEMTSAWFEYMLHPRYRGGAPVPKRAIDVLVASALGLLLAPPLLLLALIIRRDGGPALFRQTRIGEGGHPFTLYKLRTMHLEVGDSAQWASADDPRVTRIGHFLRRMHLDEVPQVLNVIRGEMSLVGPRPEQPHFVDRLEDAMPFYARRHLVKPGMTGWAQVRCGYAGSDVGSAWKLCHDLYYLRHRALVFDLVVLAETLRKVFVDPHVDSEPASVSFILPAAPRATYAAAKAA